MHFLVFPFGSIKKIEWIGIKLHCFVQAQQTEKQVGFEGKSIMGRCILKRFSSGETSAVSLLAFVALLLWLCPPFHIA